MTRKGMATPASVAPRVGTGPAPPGASATVFPAPANPRGWDAASRRPEKPAAGRNTASTKSGRENRIRVSLRLDPDRHLRLKILAGHEGRTLQSLLVAALDDYFGRYDSAAMDRICETLTAEDGHPRLEGFRERWRQTRE
ncbi:MAG: hypothetical protein ACE5KF_05740 [Kiloniellaceae bacterium]